jgi:hypothetical protein
VRLHPDESSMLTGCGRSYQYEVLDTGEWHPPILISNDPPSLFTSLGTPTCSLLRAVSIPENEIMSDFCGPTS